MIDLRSDTVTQPSEDMLDAMRRAETGDDVYGEDPTVNELESQAANLTGKPAALFVSSGTQSNLLALLSHCQRGDEYIAGQDAHTYRYEAGGAAVLGGIQPQPIAFNPRGELDLETIAAVIKPDDYHFAKTRLVCLENTQAGRVLSMDYLEKFSTFADAHSLNTHLDGARAFNAAVKLDVDIKDIASHFGSMSICLSKGLAAPVGSILVGDSALIASARRYRKMLGGGMRQAGILAAAGIYALNHHVARLAQDHHHAAVLADALRQSPGFRLKSEPETNMVHLDLPAARFKALQAYLLERDVRVSSLRWVTHRDTSLSDIEYVIECCQAFHSDSN